MYRRCAVKLHKRQVEFINCVNMVERVKRARALPLGMSNLGLTQYIFSSFDLGGKAYLTMKDCG